MSERPPISAWLRSSPAKQILHGAAIVAVLYGYMRLMEAFGGFSSLHFYHQSIELVLVLYLYGLLYTALKPSRWRPLLALLPILLIYVVHDLYYLVFGKVIRIISITELPELLQILPQSYTALIIAALVLPPGLYLLWLDYRRLRGLVLWLLPVVLLAGSVKVIPEAFARSFEQLGPGIVKYSDGKSVEQNGRLAMLAYREAQRSIALEQLEPYQDRKGYEQEAAALVDELRPHPNRRNVHLIVLESFLDPRLFRELGFSRAPAHPAFDKLFGDKLGFSISSVFGGSTAQAEFEVLCGVPAFERFSGVEFNAFTGAAAHCLPGTLTALGYRTVSTNPYKPNFFNALPGYQGSGFSEIHFPREFYSAEESYLSVGDPGVEEYIFDRDLFKQNLQFVSNHQQEHPDKPLFNYVLTIYGHTPHPLDPEQRPELIELHSDYPDDHLHRAVNQFYYRTEAIAEYVNKLLEMDSESLIILVSDHVPPLRNGPNTYKALRYLDNREDSFYYNRLAVLENGKAMVYPVLHHYELQSIVFNYLSDGEYCRNHDCALSDPPKHLPREAYMERYLRMMAHAAE